MGPPRKTDQLNQILLGEGIRVNNQKLQNFIDLVTFDQNFIVLESSIIDSEKKIQKLQSNLLKMQKDFDHKIHEKKELKKSFDLEELQVKDLQEKEKNQIAVMNQLKHQKEIDAATKQLEHFRFDRNKHEKKLMQIWNAYQSLEKELEQFQVSYDSKVAETKDEILKEEKALQALQEQLKDHSGQRQSKISLLPEEWMGFYENMRGRVPNPVVPVLQDSCSACFYLISSRDLQLLRQQELVLCKDCYRFLYVEQVANN
ncbi:hypothetical protein HYV11_00500 [Candidatus Dependentiae bacterium]|nr:hypothetical protein [Candidatus Dependentiae bacterium]